jgi:hypothetical protein
MRDAAPPDLDSAEDGLGGKRGRATADDPLPLFGVPTGQDHLGIGVFDGLLEEAAFEHLAVPFDGGFEVFGEIGIVRGHGQFQAELGMKDQALILDLDCLGGDRSLKPVRGTHGDGLRWRGGVATRALLPIPSQLLQIRAQTGDRQVAFCGVPRQVYVPSGSPNIPLSARGPR